MNQSTAQNDQGRIRASIIVCTYNRCELLRKTLQSLVCLSANEYRYEIIVIDNNSDDDPQVVVDDIRRKSGFDIKFCRETRQGLSHARNAGVRLASGEILAFVDDDEEADAEWLNEIVRTYDADKDIACTGGKIIPVFSDGGAPSWYIPELSGFFGGVDNGESICEIIVGEGYLGGGNFSFRKDAITGDEPFNISLGRTGDSFYTGEESELCIQFIQRGLKVYYNPRAITYHDVSAERLTRVHLFKRAFQSGMSDALMDCKRNLDAYGRQRTIRLIKQYGLILLKGMGSLARRTIGCQGHSIVSMLSICRAMGKISGIFFLSKKKRVWKVVGNSD